MDLGENILIFDTSIASVNTGDEIICQAVRDELRDVFPRAFFLNTPTHEKIGSHTHHLNQISKYSFVAGTNLLSSNLNSYRQWKVGFFDALHLRNIVLMGVGWWQYQGRPNYYTSWIYRRLLSKSISHSVRDTYTLRQLKSAGFLNVINTGCPTIWQLTPQHCAEIPRQKGECAVFTITDYNQDRARDSEWIQILKQAYSNLFFWPQGAGDIEYANQLNMEGVEVLGSSLNDFDSALALIPDIDYVGTRLHAGIRALQRRRRSIILGIDNRAIEMHRDFALPVIPRGDGKALRKLIDSDWETRVLLDPEAIARWKAQFVV